jgi:hypothetical protein
MRVETHQNLGLVSMAHPIKKLIQNRPELKINYNCLQPQVIININI